MIDDEQRANNPCILYTVPFMTEKKKTKNVGTIVVVVHPAGKCSKSHVRREKILSRGDGRNTIKVTSTTTNIPLKQRYKCVLCNENFDFSKIRHCTPHFPRVLGPVFFFFFTFLDNYSNRKMTFS